MKQHIYTGANRQPEDNIEGKKFVFDRHGFPQPGDVYATSSARAVKAVIRFDHTPQRILKEYVEPTTPELVPKHNRVQSFPWQGMDSWKPSIALGYLPTTELIAAACATVNGEDGATERLRSALKGFAEPAKPEPRYFTQGHYVHDRTRGAGSYAPYTAETDKLAQQLADTLNETENNNA